MSKRDDIQWLRALAILAVLAFHIWPETFPFGYLGVDVFFIISGFLMTTILGKKSEDGLWLFFWRRIKRILPTCLFVILITLSFGFLSLLPAQFAYLQTEALWSALFCNNFYSMVIEKPYFELLSSYNFLLHTWSLGVEVQFYLIAPFLIPFILARKKVILWLLTFAGMSFLFGTVMPHESITFGLVFCRIWQFLAGTAAYCLLNNTNYKYHGWYATTISIITSLVVITFWPFTASLTPFIPQIFQIMVTGLTAVFIILSYSSPIHLPSWLNDSLVFIGNASYSIYLVHWPIIIFFKYLSLIDVYGNFVLLTSIFVISIAVYKGFEQTLLRFPWKHNVSVIGAFYVIILIFSRMNVNLDLNSSGISDPIKLNEIEHESCKKLYYSNCSMDPLIEKYLTVRAVKSSHDIYCSYTLNNSESNRTILLVGNSFVKFQIRGILDAINSLKTKFSKVFVISHPICSPIIGSLNLLYKGCEKTDGSIDNFIEAVKPDIILHTAQTDIFRKKVSRERFEAAVLKSMLAMTKHTDHLVIIQETIHWDIKYHYSFKNPLNIATMLAKNQSVSHFFISIKEYHLRMDASWNGVIAASKHCPKCSLIPTTKLFCNNKICPMVNPVTQVAMYCDDGHITPSESLKLIPDIVKTIDGFYQ